MPVSAVSLSDGSMLPVVFADATTFAAQRQLGIGPPQYTESAEAIAAPSNGPSKNQHWASPRPGAGPTSAVRKR
jgi:hypothetical protein